MDARLLTSSQADERAVQSIGDTVRLCVFQGKSGQDQIGKSGSRELDGLPGVKMYSEIKSNKCTNLFVLAHDIFEQLIINLAVIPSLLKMHAINLFCLNVRGIV
jgi:hypothetical protein